MKLAIDVGSGFTQYRGESGVEGSFPSTVCPVNKDMDLDFGATEDMLLVMEGKKFLFGKHAQAYGDPDTRVDTLDTDWSTSLPWKVLLCAAMVECGIPSIDASGGENGAVKVNLCTGIPQRLYTKHKDAVAANLDGITEFSVVGKRYKVDIKVLLLPQATGAIVHKISLDESLIDNAIGVVDVGTFTTGIAVLDEGEYVSHRSSGCEVGVSQLSDALATQLYTKYSHTVDSAKIPRILQKKKIQHRGEIIDIAEDIETVQKQVVYPVLQMIKKRWGSADDLLVFVAGGGAPFFLESIKSAVPHAKMMDDHFYAVVRGLWEYQEIQLG